MGKGLADGKREESSERGYNRIGICYKYKGWERAKQRRKEMKLVTEDVRK